MPRPNAPEYIIGSVAIEPKRFLEWVKAKAEYMSNGRNRDGQTVKVIRIDLKRSQSGRAYAALDTWKPNFQPNDPEV